MSFTRDRIGLDGVVGCYRTSPDTVICRDRSRGVWGTKVRATRFRRHSNVHRTIILFPYTESEKEQIQLASL